jgi:predicted amidohydrolase
MECGSGSAASPTEAMQPRRRLGLRNERPTGLECPDRGTLSSIVITVATGGLLLTTYSEKTGMRICAAQSRPLNGDIRENISAHKLMIDLAVSNGADAVFFPELSLTGYEPRLANQLAVEPGDNRLAEFQTMSDANRITIGVGVPIRSGAGICISLALFQPHRRPQLHSKQYLHPDEEPFFVAGQNIPTLSVGADRIAPAICYEISIPNHAERAARDGAGIYVASVAKFVSGVDKALQRLSEIGRRYSMTVLMANCVGVCDGCDCAGKTSAWNNKGVLLGQLNGSDTGILILDTDTQEVIDRRI